MSAAKSFGNGTDSRQELIGDVFSFLGAQINADILNRD